MHDCVYFVPTSEQNDRYVSWGIKSISQAHSQAACVFCSRNFKDIRALGKRNFSSQVRSMAQWPPPPALVHQWLQPLCWVLSSWRKGFNPISLHWCWFWACVGCRHQPRPCHLCHPTSVGLSEGVTKEGKGK